MYQAAGSVPFKTCPIRSKAVRGDATDLFVATEGETTTYVPMRSAVKFTLTR